MKVTYDAEVDVLMIYLRDGKYQESDEVAHNVIMDFDAEGRALAIEILEAKRTLDSLALTVELPSQISAVQKAEERKNIR